MTQEEFGFVLDRIDEAKGILVDPDLNLIYTCHYNETLLHPQWFSLYKQIAKRGWRTGTFTNGMVLTPRNVRLLEDLTPNPNEFVIVNCPASDASTWSALTGKSEKMFGRLLENITAVVSSPLLAKRTVIQVNTLFESDDKVRIGKNAPMTRVELIEGGSNSIAFWQQNFPALRVTPAALFDRAETIPDVLLETNKVVDPTDCLHSHETGGRIFGGLHVAATGDVFLCCNDFYMEYRFGNLFEKPLIKIWGSASHIEVIGKALRNICTRCSFAGHSEKKIPPERTLPPPPYKR